MLNILFNVIFFATMLQMTATAVIFAFMEDRVIEFSNEAAGVEAFGRFLEEFGASSSSFRKQMALMHYWEALVAALIVIGMFLFGNYRLGHLFAAVGCAGFAVTSQILVNTVGSMPQIQGNEAMIEHSAQGIMMFAVLAAANFVAFLLSKKPFFPSVDDCTTDHKEKTH